MSVSNAFAAVGDGSEQVLAAGEAAAYAVTGTWAQTLLLQRRIKGGWAQEVSTTINTTGTITNRTNTPQQYRWRCDADTSGTSTCTIVPSTGETLAGLDDVRNPRTNALLVRFRDDGVEIPNLVGNHVSQAAARTDGVGAKNGATVSVVESGVGLVHKTVLTLATTPIALTDDAGVAQWGTLKLYDFPAGTIKVLGAVIDADLTLDDTEWVDNTQGDVALGSVASTDGSALATTLGDILSTTAIAALTAQVGAIDAQSLADEPPLGSAGGTDDDCNLNMLIDDNAAHITGTGSITGTVTLTWINLGDLG